MHAPEHEHHHADGEHCQTCAVDYHHVHEKHLDGISAISIREKHPLNYQKLMPFLETLISARQRSVSGKRSGAIDGIGKPVILQGVQTVFSPLAYDEEWPDENLETRLVIIGNIWTNKKQRLICALCCGQ